MKRKAFLFLWASLFVTPGLLQKQREGEIEDIGEVMSISEINKGHDDIHRPQNNPLNNAIVNKEKIWKSPVQYTFDESIGLNRRGIVLKAFDRFRLKSCIDFKQWDKKEEYYINVISALGCWSLLGKEAKNGQPLSIGDGCQIVSIAEHEFLHALGFHHEHQRSDRDGYVTINFTNVMEGNENNFDKVEKYLHTTYGTDYDYWSVMHYGPYSFSNGNGTTIIAKNRRYMNIIGQIFGMSATDVLELNQHYKCESSLAFMLHCDFSCDVACPVSTCSNSTMKWEKVKTAIEGPSSDHTSLPSGDAQAAVRLDKDLGFFMHVNTALGQLGDSAWLETKRVTPKRECIIKCLQFYYYHTKSNSNDLNVWIREFEDEQDVVGRHYLVDRISGTWTKYWQINYVPIGTSKSFQVEFEVRKGALPSTGGISIDDINLSEFECPHATLQINNIQNIYENAPEGFTIYSENYYSRSGYRYSFGVSMQFPFIGMFIQLVSGKYDDELPWPVPDTQVTLQLVDQTPNIQSHMSYERSITSDLARMNGTGPYRWGKPKDHGTFYIDDYDQVVFYGPKIGLRNFFTFEKMQLRQFMKGGSAVFNVFFEDISPLNYVDEMPCPPEWPKKYDEHDKGPCSPKTQTTTTHPQTTDDDIRTTHSKETTKDKSIFDFAPNKISSPVLIFLGLLVFFVQ